MREIGSVAGVAFATGVCIGSRDTYESGSPARYLLPNPIGLKVWPLCITSVSLESLDSWIYHVRRGCWHRGCHWSRAEGLDWLAPTVAGDVTRGYVYAVGFRCV